MTTSQITSASRNILKSRTSASMPRSTTCRTGSACSIRTKRLIVCNRRYQEMYQLPPELTAAGTTLQSLMNYRAETGQAPLDTNQHGKERQDRMAAGAARSYKMALCDGRTLQIDYEPMPSGGWVTTHQDITEATRTEARITFLARHDWLTESAQPSAIPRRARRRADQRQLQQQQNRTDLDRPRSIQGRQRYARSSGRRRIAQGGVRAVAPLRTQDRHCRPAWRRRIRHHPLSRRPTGKAWPHLRRG